MAWLPYFIFRQYLVRPWRQRISHASALVTLHWSYYYSLQLIGLLLGGCYLCRVALLCFFVSFRVDLRQHIYFLRGHPSSKTTHWDVCCCLSLGSLFVWIDLTRPLVVFGFALARCGLHSRQRHRNGSTRLSWFTCCSIIFMSTSKAHASNFLSLCLVSHHYYLQNNKYNDRSQHAVVLTKSKQLLIFVSSISLTDVEVETIP